MTGVNDRYDHMCETAEAIRAGFDVRGNPNRLGGDRFFMQGQWWYAPELLHHLITCAECDRRAKERIKSPIEVPVTVTIRALMEICQKYDQASLSTQGYSVFRFICEELKTAIPSTL